VSLNSEREGEPLISFQPLILGRFQGEVFLVVAAVDIYGVSTTTAITDRTDQMSDPEEDQDYNYIQRIPEYSIIMQVILPN
jgi:hypothetical protein